MEFEYSRIATRSDLLNKVKRYPSIGLGYIAGSLEVNGYDVHFLDMFIDRLDYQDVFRYLNENSFDVVGISCNIATLVPTKKIARIVKKNFPGIVVVVGGVIVTQFPAEVMDYLYFDVAVLGEGETTIVEIARAIAEKRTFADIKGIVYREKGQINMTGPPRISMDLDAIPFPAWHLMPYKKYGSDISKNKNMIILTTSRGCPFHCIFCYHDEPWRARSPKNVVDEIELLNTNFAIKEYYFVDSTFSVNRERVVSICKEILRRKLDITWQCETRLDCLDDRLLNIMKRAGCVRILCGVESGDNGILKRINKNLTLIKISRTIALIKKHGLEVFASFVIGWPGDTIATIQKTISFAKQLDVDFAFFGIATPGPFTDMFEIAISQGIVDKNIWRDFVLGKEKSLPTPSFITDEYDMHALSRLLASAYRSFYFRPRFILKRLLSLSSVSEFLNNLHGFKNVIFELIYSLFS